MKVTDFVAVCPYPGLRSFTEEESIYFKGRDQQVDQITSLLEKNKFLMVSGASGEGKSSLIYGGLVPNARAGFFKAKFSNWAVASFRPERNPVRNLALVLAEKLELNPVTVETELRRGYSSLIDLYEHSDFYPGAGHLNLTEKEIKAKQRNAANLLIIADQFEEFFTNPENYYKEAPSTDAQIVVNLLLETARISIKRNLPVFIVCTMRSDYIGQCSAFRGLPEYIGFSQFFVPRLKRVDLKQVIEEPALLSGNSISQRLIERLVFDMADGVDQLPILQHALNQIWLAADHGREQMDLLHYAMVGGMPPDDLPEDDFNRYQEWFKKVPAAHQVFYRDTGLSRVIDIHANLLYENAAGIYNDAHPAQQLSDEEVKTIISATFTGLTKIDNSRAVRNRMTLAEITGLINNPAINTRVAGEVINLFREEGNSFIHPFKTQDPATDQLEPDTVLDITHESLIRNWDKLEQWAKSEFESYSVWLDFRKQLDRWRQSGRRSGYLLPIGPLTFFENWYKKSRPNKAWVMRYAGVAENKEVAEKDAVELIRDADLFLKRSAQKEFFARTFMKYGARRIATVFAILIMVVLTGFYWYDADQKKNENVIERIRAEANQLLSSQEVNLNNKAIYLLAQERLDGGSLMSYLNKQNTREQLRLASETYGQLVSYNKHDTSALTRELFRVASGILLKSENVFTPAFALNENNKFMVFVAMDQYYNPDTQKKEILAKLTDRGYELVMDFYRNRNLYGPTIPTELNLAVQYWLTFGNATPEKINDLLQLISPAENETAAAAFSTWYAKGSFEPAGRSALDFNGGYHTLASLYAAAGNPDKIEWCFRQLLSNEQRSYFELPRVFNNHLNVLGYLYQFNHRQEVPRLLNWIAANTNDNPPITLIRNVVIRAGYITHLYLINYKRTFFRSHRGYMYPNLYFCERPVFEAMVADYDSLINRIGDADERNFQAAMNLKRRAVFTYKYQTDRQLPLDSAQLDSWLNKAFDTYELVNTAYREGTEATTLVYNSDGVRNYQISRKALMIYPDYRDGWFAWTFHGDYVFDYLLRKQLLQKLYTTGKDLQLLHLWVTKNFEIQDEMPRQLYSNWYELKDEVLQSVLNFVNTHPAAVEFDKNLPLIVLSNRCFSRGDTAGGMKYYRDIQTSGLRKSSELYEYLEKEFIFNEMKKLSIHLSIAGHMKEGIQIAELFPGPIEKTSVYADMAERMYRNNADPGTFELADSAWSNMQKSDFTNGVFSLDARPSVITMLSEIGSKKINQAAGGIVREIQNDNKFNAILAQVRGVTIEGNYYRALTTIPNTLTESQDLQCRALILIEACRQKEFREKNTRWKPMDIALFHNIDYTTFYPF